MTTAPLKKPAPQLVETDGRLLRAAQIIAINADLGITPRLTPCDPVTKHPPLNKWQERATSDLGQLEGLCKKYPRATMLSLLVGADAGFFVLDLDASKNGLANFAELESKHGQRPRTPECITGSNGRHVFFRFPKGVNVYNRASDSRAHAARLHAQASAVARSTGTAHTPIPTPIPRERTRPMGGSLQLRAEPRGTRGPVENFRPPKTSEGPLIP